MRYKITEYTLNRADQLNVIVKPSEKRFKKIDVFDKNGNYIVSVGDSRYLDFPYYIKNFGIKEAIKRRRLYKLRHKADKDIKGTAGYYADKLLW